MTNDIQQYLGWCIDPIHIGTGEYRLGRVDNCIVREPATDIPKIPGTSFSGVLREFVSLNEHEKKEKLTNKLFGTLTHRGAIRCYDGHIVLFPIRSDQGTVWITTIERLNQLKIPKDPRIAADSFEKTDTIYLIQNTISSDSESPKTTLVLGWLMLPISTNIENLNRPENIPTWVSTIAIVPNKLFIHLVNDNLEVRTSVKIDPETGAASDGALFTYEAIPRGTFIQFEVGCSEADKPTIETAMKSLSVLGIGGMTTRGFGRFKVLDGDSQ